MIKTDAATRPMPEPSGLRVVPDELRIPVFLHGEGPTPDAALDALLARAEALDEVLGEQASATFLTYESWTEKLAGKGFRGRGVRHHAKARLRVHRTFAEADTFIERLRGLEALRTRLGTLDDGSTLRVGKASWALRDKEAYRERLIARLDERCAPLRALSGASEVCIQGAYEVRVQVVGPREAYVRLGLELSFRASRSELRASAEPQG